VDQPQLLDEEPPDEEPLDEEPLDAELPYEVPPEDEPPDEVLAVIAVPDGATSHHLAPKSLLP
jgi:hypothetical protein